MRARAITFPDIRRRVERTGRLLFWGEMLMVAGFVVYRIVTGILEPPTIIGTAVIPTAQPARTSETVRLTRGDYALYRYAPGDPALAAHPKALIIFGSGDGGADGWEDRVCRALQADGYEVISFDCARYAVTDYDLPTLQADMAALARSLPHDPPVPLILGGWSMGAEQAVAAAGGPDRSPNLAGLLLVSPGSRGRYGLRSPDRWNVPPKGAGTFALTDFATKLGGLRVAQWDGRLDLLDSTAWLNGVTTTHKTFSYTLGFHDYGGASDEFLNQVKQSVAWILSSGP